MFPKAPTIRDLLGAAFETLIAIVKPLALACERRVYELLVYGAMYLL